MNGKQSYSDFSNIKTFKDKEREHRNSLIRADIDLVEKALISEDENYLREVHRTIDGKYQASIRNWGMGMYNFNPQYGFIYDCLDMESLRDNLRSMKPKLEAYLENWNCISVTSSQDNADISVVVNNSNHINLNVTFEQAKQKIEDMAGLTQKDTEEIQKKIDELEKISNEGAPKKKKWEKIKPILAFALDKGVDVAITIMELILQMKLGV